MNIIKSNNLFSLFTCLLGASVAQAAVVSITGFDASSTAISSFTVTATANNPTVYSFTRTGNLDGGTVNDTLSFDLTYTLYTGSTFDGTGAGTLGTSVAQANLGNAHFINNYTGDTDTNSVAAGDSMTLSVSNLSYTSGEGFTAPVLAFNGFNEISKFGNGTADIYLGADGSDVRTISSANEPLSLGGVTSLTMTASAVSNQRWRDLDFSFTVPDAVPEPSSTSLLGLAGLVLILRRRKA